MKIKAFRSFVEKNKYNIGLSALDNSGCLFFVADARFIYRASNSLKEPELIFDLQESNLDVRGIFVSSNNKLFLGVKRFNKPPFGRTYRIDLNDCTIKMILPYAFWGMDEDQFSRIFLGVYHEINEPDCKCAVYCSLNYGDDWYEITPPLWEKQTHVHHLAINPYTQFLYATLGDKKDLVGCWRSKVRLSKITSIASCRKKITLEHPIDLHVDDELLLVSSQHKAQYKVVSVEDNLLELCSEIPSELNIAADPLVYKNDWLNKFCNLTKGLQFVGIAFDESKVFLSDDSAPAISNGAGIYMGYDNDDTPQDPEVVLNTKNDTSAWGCFFLEKDCNGVYWTAVRPFKGNGVLYSSKDGYKWQIEQITQELSLKEWRVYYPFRDFTMGQTGYTRTKVYSKMQVNLISVSNAAFIVTRKKPVSFLDKIKQILSI